MNAQQQAYKETRARYEEVYNLSGEKQETLLKTWPGDLEGEDLERYAEIASSMECEIRTTASK